VVVEGGEGGVDRDERVCLACKEERVWARVTTCERSLAFSPAITGTVAMICCITASLSMA